MAGLIIDKPHHGVNITAKVVALVTNKFYDACHHLQNLILHSTGYTRHRLANLPKNSMKRPAKNPMLYEIRGMCKQHVFSLVALALWNCLSKKDVPHPPSWHFTKAGKTTLFHHCINFYMIFCTLFRHSESNNVVGYQDYVAE